MSHLVSILIPAFNAGKWIESTIQSAIGQTWPETEVIIVDDGSTDDTVEKARKFESSSVKIVVQKNKGASAARNVALSLAQGDFIQWLDADDLLAPDKITQQLSKTGYDGSTQFLLSSSCGKFGYRIEKAVFAPNALWQDLSPVEWLLTMFNNNVCMYLHSWLVSRKLTEMAGPWNEALSLDDDGEYFSRVAAKSSGIRFIRDAKCYYRNTNVGSLSRKISAKACQSLTLSLKLTISHLRGLEASERTRTASIKYLEQWFNYFYYYPLKLDIIDDLKHLAAELNGTFLPPRLEWKYAGVRALLGLQAAKIAKHQLPLIKFRARLKLDELMYRLS
jgi:glycosyltransferase involved in cell wall biosynthesis